MVKIIDCPEGWWYESFIGYEFFGEIRYFKHEYKEPEVHVCRLTKNSIIRGRDVLLKHCMIL